MLKPLGSHVVVEPVVQEEKTASGIYLPDTAAKEKPQQGKVIAVGNGKYTDNGKKDGCGLIIGHRGKYFDYSF